MIYEILNDNGEVVNTIVAELDFVELVYPGKYREVYVPTNPVKVKAEIVAATQQRLDAFAKTRDYDGVLSLCTYASSVNPKFKQEGQYGVEARDTTWAKVYDIFAEIDAGTRPVPDGYAAIESELPVLEWPI